MVLIIYHDMNEFVVVRCIAFTKTDAKERPLTRLTMSALQSHWLGLLLSIFDVRAQIVHSLLILRVTCHRAVPPAAHMIGLLL